ncbi:MAG TPA: hypothetical protein VHX20_09160 [Terracidiphilus sp.]|jgi:hypothetical protein|nr:hypothetical protein [Terracidiphilus sp.]
MTVAIAVMRVLEWMFFLGLAGSTIVIVVSFIDYARVLFVKSE